MLKVLEYNCETNEEILRDMTPEELEAQMKVEKNLSLRATEAEEKQLKRQAVLNKLGLSLDEINALLG